jgi:hypothetical protein
MKLITLITANAILFVASGITFVLYGPMLLAFFGVPQLAAGLTVYWHVASFARMFGAALFGLGLLLWAVSRATLRQGVIFALLLSNLLAAIVSLTQQISIWGTPVGWVASGVFVILTLAYGYFMVMERS